MSMEKSNLLSVIILTKNEEKNIRRCLESVRKLADEIIVIDDKSTDNTVEIAKSLSATVYERELNDDFSSQRNFGLEKAKGEWILFVDADEELTPELQKEIIKLVHTPSDMVAAQGVFYLKRRDFFWGRELKYGETKKVREKGLVRLVQKESGKWLCPVHEEFQSDKKHAYLQSYLNHYPHQTVKEFLQEVNHYSTIRAKELYKKGKKTNIFEIIAYPFGKFTLNYLFKLGFRDGAAGLAYAFFMSFHSFLVRAKLYQYWEIDK